MLGCVPGPPKEPKIMDQYPKIESIGSLGSIILGSFGGPGMCGLCRELLLGSDFRV